MNMFSFSELMPLAPAMIVAFTAIIVMLLIALKRNHAATMTVTMLGLAAATALVLDKLWAVVHQQFQPSNVMDMFTIDPFTLVYQLMILVAALACCILAKAYINTYKDNREELYILMLVSVVGALLMVASTHYASFFISLETMSVPIYGMLAYTYQRGKSLESGLKYLVLSATASAMLLMGFAYLYAYTGDMSFINSAQKIVHLLNQPLVIVGLALIIFACAFKLSLAPFHKWTSDVYQGAPTPMTIFLATVAKIAMLGLVLRYVLTSGSLVPNGIMTVLTVIAVLSILFGNLSAVFQGNIKRVLAYSSIAHFGYLLVALISTDVSSISAITVYIAVYALTTIGAFGAIALMSSPYNNLDEADDLEEYRGLFWRHPVLTTSLATMLLSLAGVPMTAGFPAKFVVLVSATAAAQWFLAAMVVVGSGIGLYFYLRVMIIMYSAAPEKHRIDAHANWEFSAGGLLVLFITLMVLVLGFYPEPLYKFAEMARLLVLH